MFKDKTKIIHLFAPGPLGGAEKVIISGLRELRKEHENIELWLIKESRLPEVCDFFLKHIDKTDIKIKVFETDKPLDLNLKKRLTSSLMESQVSIIHAHGIKASFYGYLSKPNNSKFILTHHGNTSHNLKVKIYEYIEQIIMRKADSTIAVSHIMHESLILKNIKNVELVENLLSFIPITRTAPHNKKLEMVIIGRISPEKGHLDLLEALTKITFDFNLQVIGTGNSESMVLDFIKENNLEDKVQFIGFKDEIKEYLSKADVLLMPSHREGLPMILIEALCIGTPVIGSSVGGLKYLVSNNGILFSPQNTIEIVDSLKLFNKDKSIYLDIALEMTKEFQKRFHPNRWAKDTIKVYKKVLSHK